MFVTNFHIFSSKYSCQLFRDTFDECIHGRTINVDNSLGSMLLISLELRACSLVMLSELETAIEFLLESHLLINFNG